MVHIDSKSASSLIRLDIFRYIHDRGTSLACATHLSIAAPKINSLYLDTPDEGVIGRLATFKNLTRLKLSKINAIELQKSLLDDRGGLGARLRTLEIVNGRGSVDLSILARLGLTMFALNLVFIKA